MDRIKIILHTTFIFILLAGFVIGQQGQQVKNSIVTGEVVSVEPGKVVLKTEEGELQVEIAAATEFKRVPPENPVLRAAVASSFEDIGVGDKLMVTGMMSADKRSLPAKAVYLMSKSDLAQRAAKDREKWATRGISGQVKSINAETRQITIDVSRLGNTTSVVITPKERVKFLRYAPNSVEYSEAVPSKLGDIAPGDMIRALGDRSADGASFAAEEIVTGAFQTVAGVVKFVDTAKNEIVISELQGKKDVTISLASASLVKRFPEQMAMMLAARQNGPAGPGGPPAGGQRGQGGQSGQGAQAGGQPARPSNGMGPGGGPGGGMPRGGIDEMIDRFPTISAADLKLGEMIAVSSSKTESMEKITAIKLLAGVEPFVRAAQMASAAQRGGMQTLSIPGLDGFDMP